MVEGPPVPKHRQLARQVGAPACQLRHPSKFRMADYIRPLRLGTIVWLGSLEFMSLGHEYDMVLLTPRTPPSDDEVAPRQPRRRRRPGGRSRHARQARREQGHPDATRAQGDTPLPADVLRPAVGTGSLARDLSDLSLDEGKSLVAPLTLRRCDNPSGQRGRSSREVERGASSTRPMTCLLHQRGALQG